MKPLKATLLVLVFVPFAVFAANLGLIDGTLTDANGNPMSGATVSLFAPDGRRVDQHRADQSGHFEFEQVPFGMYMLRASGADGRIAEQQIRVASGDVVQVALTFRPAAAEEEIQVVGVRRAPAPAKTAASASTLEHEEIQNLPRGDTASVNEILATQPGFVYDAMGNLFARGNHANIQYQIDGVPLPDSVSGLFGGFLSPKFVDNMEVLTGGLSAEYGERLAAVVNLNSRRPSEQGEGEIEVAGGSYSTLNPSIFYGKKIGALSFLGGGSFRTTTRALDPQAFDDLSHDKGDEERGFLRLDYDVDDHNRISALGTFAHNFYRIPIDPTVPPFDPNQPNGGRAPDQYGNAPPPFFPRNTNQSENERDAFAMLSLRHDFDQRSTFRAAATYRHSYGFLFGDAQNALGPTADPCVTDAQGNTTCSTTSDVGRTADHLGGIAEQLVRIGEDHVVKAGAQIDQLFGSTDFTSYTRSDALRAPDPAQTVRGTDTSRSATGGVYLQDRATFGALVVNAGMRVDFQHIHFVGSSESSTDVGFGPRLGLAYSLTQDTVVHAYGGLLWQPPPVLDTPAAARILGVVPADQPIRYDLKAEEDRYAEVGIESRVVPALTLKLTGWGKLSKHQLDDVGVGSTNLVSPYNFRDGRAGGIEAGAVLVLGRRLSAFGNVGVEKAQGRGIETAQYLFAPDDVANNNWQILDHVQTWTANGGATLREGNARLSGLLDYGSGLRTGAANNQHVPGHARFDLSLGYEFRELPARPSIAVDLVNVFDEHYAYRIANGFNGSHVAPGRSIYVRLGSSF